MSKTPLYIRLISSCAILCTIAALIGITLLLQSKEHIFGWIAQRTAGHEKAEPFPVGVNAYTKAIEENPSVNQFFTQNLASAAHARQEWWSQVAEEFANHDWYQNLAAPVSRIIVIWPGQRKEEVAKHIADVLRWNTEERTAFMQLIDSAHPILSEGKYLPGQYVTHREATPAEMHQVISDAFANEVLERYTPKVAARVPFEQALIVASLIEREASDFRNMREVSGVIWNRLFIDMPLQLDATLQYVRGSNPYEARWWPTVTTQDKYLTSKYNTYQHTGLPPAPIASPSVEAILAALNPSVTDCLFYFHTANGAYHCSKTYEGHVNKLRSLYGRGS